MFEKLIHLEGIDPLEFFGVLAVLEEALLRVDELLTRTRIAGLGDLGHQRPARLRTTAGEEAHEQEQRQRER